MEILPGQTVAECEYCGTKQTLPRLDDDRRANLYDRANHFRRNNEFDKAMGIYEKILTEDSTDAESYWSLVLCRYGIEYVEDPVTHKRVPTVNRAQFTSIFDDDNYKSAIQYADGYQCSIYEAEARAINEIQKGILAISQKEEPFDVFICYKESDSNGRRTPDSVLANDLYHQLTQEGFKVFFSRITLEDKLGTAYEPYIFAALNSAKVMVVLGTRPEYFNAVWVKNEWSRYLSLIKQGQKKMLIPAYKDMDPYDLPEEFSHLQAQDMSKLGFMQDLIRGIKKITQTEAPVAVVEAPVVATVGSSNVDALLERGNMALEDGEWDKAMGFFEDVLNNDARNAAAYLGETLAQEHCQTLDDFIDKRLQAHQSLKREHLQLTPNESHIAEIAKKYVIPGYCDENAIRTLYSFDLSYVSVLAARKEHYKDEENYWANHNQLSRAEKFATDAFANTLMEAKSTLFHSLQAHIDRAERADVKMIAQLKKDYAAHTLQADKEAELLYQNATVKREQDYQAWVTQAEQGDKLLTLASQFEKLYGYRDSDAMAEQCRKRQQAEMDKMDAERAQKAEIARREAERIARRNKRIAIICAIVAAMALAVILVITQIIVPNAKYNGAVALMEAGRYEEAVAEFEAMDGYKDSLIQAEVCETAILEDKYNAAVLQMESGNIVEAYEALILLDGYKDSIARSASIYDEYKIKKLKDPNVGDYVFFGSYEQDSNTSNGVEDIEWLVLEKAEGKILLLSKYALDCKQYNTSRERVTWKTCSLRKWLNDSFINTAFTADEQSMIFAVTVSAGRNPEYDTDPGNTTKDKVFLLSIAEVNQYFTSDSERLCMPTNYAVDRGVNLIHENCSYFLRSPGADNSSAALIGYSGNVVHGGSFVDYREGAIRPAIWLNIGD